MQKTSSLFIGLAIAAASLSSCSRANYAFNSTAPAYLGSEQARTSRPVAAAAAEATPATTPEVALPVVKAAPAHRVARPAHSAMAAHPATKAAVAAPNVVAVKAQLAKFDRKSFKKEVKRQLAAAPKETTAEGKSQLVAALLCFFLGGLGIHDFYLGRPGKGILQIFLTLLFGIGFILVLIDLVRILIGDEKPKGGDYAKKL